MDNKKLTVRIAELEHQQIRHRYSGSIEMKNNDSPDSGMADAKGVIRIGIGLQPDKNPAIVFYDDQQNSIWRAPDRK
jgi:hypothetical protein